MIFDQEENIQSDNMLFESLIFQPNQSFMICDYQKETEIDVLEESALLSTIDMKPIQVPRQMTEQEKVDEILAELPSKNVFTESDYSEPAEEMEEEDSDYQEEKVKQVRKKKSVFKKRKDVVFKTLLRKTRKFIQKDFNRATKYLSSKRFKDDDYYLEKIIEYITKTMNCDMTLDQINTCLLYTSPSPRDQA